MRPSLPEVGSRAFLGWPGARQGLLCTFQKRHQRAGDLGLAAC